jgi:hypothetical protein
MCDDCKVALCDRCLVPIEGVGAFCWDCAAHRGGLHPRQRKARLTAEPEVPAPRLSARISTPENGRAVRQFEERMLDREPHTLISGLTEALEEAGVDPEDVVDDDDLVDDIAHLQDLAAEPEHRRWRNHG